MEEIETEKRGFSRPEVEKSAPFADMSHAICVKRIDIYLIDCFIEWKRAWLVVSLDYDRLKIYARNNQRKIIKIIHKIARRKTFEKAYCSVGSRNLEGICALLCDSYWRMRSNCFILISRRQKNKQTNEQRHCSNWTKVNKSNQLLTNSVCNARFVIP